MIFLHRPDKFSFIKSDDDLARKSELTYLSFSHDVTKVEQLICGRLRAGNSISKHVVHSHSFSVKNTDCKAAGVSVVSSYACKG